MTLVTKENCKKCLIAKQIVEERGLGSQIKIVGYDEPEVQYAILKNNCSTLPILIISKTDVLQGDAVIRFLSEVNINDSH